MRDLLNPGRFRGLTVALIVCALAMRMLIPSGFMLTPNANGALPTITICTGQGVMTMAMPVGMDPAAATGQSSHDDGSQHEDKAPDHPCAFASAGAAVDLAAVLHPVAPARAETSENPLLPAYTRPGLGLAAPPPPKTGPPILA